MSGKNPQSTGCLQWAPRIHHPGYTGCSSPPRYQTNEESQRLMQRMTSLRWRWHMTFCIGEHLICTGLPEETCLARQPYHPDHYRDQPHEICESDVCRAMGQVQSNSVCA